MANWMSQVPLKVRSWCENRLSKPQSLPIAVNSGMSSSKCLPNSAAMCCASEALTHLLAMRSVLQDLSRRSAIPVISSALPSNLFG